MTYLRARLLLNGNTVWGGLRMFGGRYSNFSTLSLLEKPRLIYPHALRNTQIHTKPPPMADKPRTHQQEQRLRYATKPRKSFLNTEACENSAPVFIDDLPEAIYRRRVFARIISDDLADSEVLQSIPCFAWKYITVGQMKILHARALASLPPDAIRSIPKGHWIDVPNKVIFNAVVVPFEKRSYIRSAIEEVLSEEGDIL